MKKRLEITWIAAWGLLLGFVIGAATLVFIGHIAWGLVGITSSVGWLISGIIAAVHNAKQEGQNLDPPKS